MADNISSNAVTREDLDGLFAERQGVKSARGLEVAPALSVESDQVEWHHWDENSLPYTAGTQNAFVKKGWKGQPSRGGLDITTATGTVDFYRFGDLTFHEKEIEKFAAKGIDIVEEYTKKIARQASKHHARTIGQYLSNSANYLAANVNGSPADIGTVTSDLITDINTGLAQLESLGIDVEDYKVCAVYPRSIARELTLLNQVRDFSAISDNALLKVGFSPRGTVENFWANAFEMPIEGIPYGGRTQNASGTTSEHMNADIALVLVSQADMEGGFIRTPTFGEEGALGRVVQYTPEKFPNSIGVYVEMAYGVLRPDNAGRFGYLLDGVS